jgi:hypothetical protein
MLADLPPSDEKSTCLLCDILLGPIWALFGLAGVGGTSPGPLTRGNWLLFFSFWGVVLTVGLLYFFGQ